MSPPAHVDVVVVTTVIKKKLYHTTIFTPQTHITPSHRHHYFTSPNHTRITNLHLRFTYSHHELTRLKQPQLKLYNSYTTATQQPHNSHTTVTQQPHNSHTTATQQPHNSHTTATQQPHNSHTTATQQPHDSRHLGCQEEWRLSLEVLGIPVEASMLQQQNGRVQVVHRSCPVQCRLAW